MLDYYYILKSPIPLLRDIEHSRRKMISTHWFPIAMRENSLHFRNWHEIWTGCVTILEVGHWIICNWNKARFWCKIPQDYRARSSRIFTGPECSLQDQYLNCNVNCFYLTNHWDCPQQLSSAKIQWQINKCVELSIKKTINLQLVFFSFFFLKNCTHYSILRKKWSQIGCVMGCILWKLETRNEFCLPKIYAKNQYSIMP